MGKNRRGDRVESGLRLRHAGDGDRGGVVLALPGSAKRQRGEPGRFRQVLLFQGAAVSRFGKNSPPAPGVVSGGGGGASRRGDRRGCGPAPGGTEHATIRFGGPT